MNSAAEPDLAMDEVTAFVPTSPAYREGVSIWVWDDARQFCFPRIGVEAVGATWVTSFATSLCMAWPDGRLLLALSDDPPYEVTDDHGTPRVLGAGPLRFRCVEPFTRWRIEFDGIVLSTDVERYLAAGEPKPQPGNGNEVRRLCFDLDAEMIAPPWFQGTQEPEGHFVNGEARFEQLCTVMGSVTLDGDSTPFSGGGLRVHRKGGDRSNYGDFHGHNWQSASFPSGRAFGFIHYRAPSAGEVRYREGWVLDGGVIRPAKVEATPWLTEVCPRGEDVSFTLRTAEGDVRVEGETFASSFRPPRPAENGTTFPLLQSGIARYRWDREEALGMIERSARLAP